MKEEREREKKSELHITCRVKDFQRGFYKKVSNERIFMSSQNVEIDTSLTSRDRDTDGVGGFT